MAVNAGVTAGGPQQALQQSSIEEVIEKGYNIIKVGAIDKLQNFLLTGDHNVIFTRKEYMRYYT
jgi:hypothetical protein